MIMFGPEHLIQLGRQKASVGEYADALGMIRSLDTPDARALKGDWSYQLAKLKVSNCEYQDAREYFAVARQHHSNPVVRSLAQKRNELINDILHRETKPVDELARQLGTVNVSPAMALPGGTLAPLIEFVGAPAAYRSGYDPEKSDPLSTLIRRLKRESDDATVVAERTRTITRLGELLSAYAFVHTPVLRDADLIIPVPGDQNRRFERGYSIPLILAGELAVRCAIPLKSDLIETTGETIDLRTIPRWQRAAAIEDAFQGTEKATMLGGLNVIVVDDILTSGSTLNEIGMDLSGLGCSKISALALAHTEWSR